MSVVEAGWARSVDVAGWVRGYTHTQIHTYMHTHMQAHTHTHTHTHTFRSEDELIPLDKYVFNTEAHPLKVWKEANDI